MKFKRITIFILLFYSLLILTENVTAKIVFASGTSTENELYKEGFVNEEEPDKICHVSSIININREKTICVWYSGSREGAKDVAIYKAIFDEREMKWSRAERFIDRIIASAELKNHIKKIGNPMLMKDPSGKIWLFYSTAAFGGWSMTTLNYKTSIDGITWTKSKKLLLSPFFNLNLNVKNDGINIDDKTFIIPAYGELFKKLSYIIKINTTDEKAEIYKVVNSINAIQPVIIPDKEGLLFFFRNASDKEKRFILTTKRTPSGWKELSSTPLPNPNSGFDMIKVDEGIILGAINYSFSNRENLSLVVSIDNGKSWNILKVLEQKEGKEYSYPSITESPNGLYHITYTYERKKIKHIVFNKTWLNNRLYELGLPLKRNSDLNCYFHHQLTKEPLTINLIFKNLSKYSHKIAVTITTVLFISTIFLKLGKIAGLKTKLLLIPSLLIGTGVTHFYINHLTFKDYFLTLSPSISCSTFILVLNFFLSSINYMLIDRKTLFHLSLIIFAISIFLYSSFFGFIKPDIYSAGYNYIYIIGIIFLITIYCISRHLSLAMFPLSYITFFITGATLTSNIFDAITDGFASFITFFIILNHTRLQMNIKI
jgi:predicted neuraminidase